jgi:urea transport system ATP-binding protein
MVKLEQQHTDACENFLEMKGVSTGYDESLILRNVDLEVKPRQVVALLGRNGVGKTTLLKTIMGLLPVKSGDLLIEQQSVKKLSPDLRARLGIGYVPQGRDIFPSLSVWENLKISLATSGTKDGSRVEEVFELFPVLKDMLKRKGGVLSGGQQQQLAIGRAMLTSPSLLILDEPTEGIQPSIIDQIEDAIQVIKARYKVSIILVEQYLDFARAASDHFYILERGSVVKEGPTEELNDDLIARHLTV